eukprot:jgi/Bigna1/85571/estExt_fgenesh1_pg.C_40399
MPRQRLQQLLHLSDAFVILPTTMERTKFFYKLRFTGEGINVKRFLPSSQLFILKSLGAAVEDPFLGSDQAQLFGVANTSASSLIFVRNDIVPISKAKQQPISVQSLLIYFEKSRSILLLRASVRDQLRLSSPRCKGPLDVHRAAATAGVATIYGTRPGLTKETNWAGNVGSAWDVIIIVNEMNGRPTILIPHLGVKVVGFSGRSDGRLDQLTIFYEGDDNDLPESLEMNMEVGGQLSGMTVEMPEANVFTEVQGRSERAKERTIACQTLHNLPSTETSPAIDTVDISQRIASRGEGRAGNASSIPSSTLSDS